MPIEIDSSLERLIESKAGRPTHYIKLYDTNYAWNSKGLFISYYNIVKIGSSETWGNTIRLFGDDSIYVDAKYLRTDYTSHLRYWWGSGYPLGISEASLNKGWGAVVEGYFLVPYTATYDFRIFSSMYCRLIVADKELYSGKNPLALDSVESIDLGESYAIPFQLAIGQVSSIDSNATPETSDAYLLVEWRKAGYPSGEWNTVDAGYFSPGATVVNLVGSAVSNYSGRRNNSPIITRGIRDIIGEVQDTVVPAQGRWLQNEEYTITFEGSFTGQWFKYYVNDVYRGTIKSHTSGYIHIGGDKYVYVNWGKIEPNSIVIIKAPSYLEPLVTTSGIPHVETMTEERAEGQATTFTFTVPITKGRWNPRRVTPDNCYSYDASTQSMGVLRKHRYLTIEQGYSDITVQRFSGFISNIDIADSSIEPKITVTCIDLSKLLIDKPITEAPDLVSWLRYGSGVKLSEFKPSQYIKDSMYKPDAYDAWNLKDVVEDLSYMAGLTSKSVKAVDSNNQPYLIDNSTRLSKSIDYPFTSITSDDGTARTSDFKWQIGIGESFWDVFNKIKTEFNRSIRILPNGAIDFRLPDNPNLLKKYYDPSGNSEYDANVNDKITSKVTPEKNVRGIRGFYYSQLGSSDEAWTIRFEGYGLALIMARTESSQRIQVEVDGTIVDGSITLDNNTEDTGDSVYTDFLTDDKWYPLQLVDIENNSISLDETDGYWSWSNGIHPSLGYNPCIIPICRNLSWGWHTVRVHTNAVGYVRLDGAFIFKDTNNAVTHTFSESSDLITVSIIESDADIRNSVIVMGTQSSRAGMAITSKAINIDSINNPESPIYIGYERPLVLVASGVNSQSKADFIASSILTRYARVIRNPTLQSVGMPQLIEGDVVSIIDEKIGLRQPISLETSQKTLTLEPARGDKYWITSISATMTQTEWTMQFQITPFSPQAAYEPVPNPPIEIWSNELIQNVELKLLHGTASNYFNPYTEDTDGERVVLEFDLPWSARVLNVTIHNRVKYKFQLHPGHDLPLKVMMPDELIRTLYWDEDFSPSGHYKISWDGWWDSGDSGEGGVGNRYMPRHAPYSSNIAEFYFKIYIQRESDGRCGWFTTDNDIPTEYITGSYPHIIMSDSTIYTGGVNYSFPASQKDLGSNAIDYTVYDDITTQPTNPGTFLIGIETDRPATFSLKCYVYLLQSWAGVSNITSSNTIVAINGAEVPVFDSPDFLPAGDYQFVFTPSAMIKNIIGMHTTAIRDKWLEEVTRIMAHAWTGKATPDVSRFEATKTSTGNYAPHLPGITPDMSLPFNYIYPTMKLQGLGIWSLWLFYFPTTIGFGAGRGGCMILDKDYFLYSNPPGTYLGTSANPHGIIVQWFGDSDIYDTTKASTSGVTLDLPLGVFNVDSVQQVANGKITDWDTKRKWTLGGVDFVKVYDGKVIG